MRLVATDFYSYLTPSKCGLRMFLRQQGIEEAGPGPYAEVIFRLGQKHEKSHLATIPGIVDLSHFSREERLKRTSQEIKNKASIYQAALRAEAKIGNTLCEIWGEPDFLICDSEQYIIRDAKISRHITEEDHPEVLRQLELYGWLYEKAFGVQPLRLEAFNGLGEIIEVPYENGSSALELLEEILSFKAMTVEPYNPVGWSKCGGCGFNKDCWKKAEEVKDVAMIVGVDQGLAAALHDDGTRTIQDFINRFTKEDLSTYQRPWGKRMQRVGKVASSILLMAKSLASGKEQIIGKPEIPNHPNYVMFDLEGLPPQLDELGKIYLWGMQVYGTRPGEFNPAVAGFGENGDRQGWRDFLSKAKAIFDAYGDIPFVHWHHYEKTHLKAYVERYGDEDGIAERVKGNLLDLLPITQKSIALPLYSYSLKVVEKYIGFKRTQEEYGGDWSMAKYIESIETVDEKLRQEVMEEILTYNKEDLAATWAVLQWLKSK